MPSHSNETRIHPPLQPFTLLISNRSIIHTFSTPTYRQHGGIPSPQQGRSLRVPFAAEGASHDTQKTPISDLDLRPRSQTSYLGCHQHQAHYIGIPSLDRPPKNRTRLGLGRGTLLWSLKISPQAHRRQWRVDARIAPSHMGNKKAPFPQISGPELGANERVT